MNEGFRFFDGDSGQSYQVVKFIDDGKFDFVSDLDSLDLIRWEGEGGSYDPEEKKKYWDMYFDWKRFYKYKGRHQRKERARKNKNYQMFGVKL